MINIPSIIIGAILILLVLVYPKIIRFLIAGYIGYLTIFVNYYYGALFIPLLIIMLIYKRKKEGGYGY